MSEFKYYNGFSLTNPITGKSKSLSDFNGIVYNPNNEKMSRHFLPEPNHITDKNENCHGERYIKTVYGVKIIEVPVFFHGEVDEMELAKWLGTDKQQTFEWEDDDDNKCIDVVYKQSFDQEIYYGEEFNANMTLNFVAHDPFWRIKNEREIIFDNPRINEIKTIKCRGNTNSFPLIKVTPNGTQNIKFKWNDLMVQLNNINKPFYIDCEKQRCYEMNNDINVLSLLKYQSDKHFNFPFISADIKNTFMLLQGDIKQVSIKPRTKIIL